MRTLRTLLVASALVVVGCADDGDAVGEAGSTTTVVDDTADTDDVGGTGGSEPGDTTAEAGAGLCEAAERAAAAFAPQDASQESFRAIGEAWAALAAELPPPHDAVAQRLADAYAETDDLWGDDPTSPSQEYMAELTTRTAAELTGSFPLAAYVTAQCGLVLPGFD